MASALVLNTDDFLKEVVLLANSAWYLKNFRSSTIEALLCQKYAVRCIVPDSADRQSIRALREIGAKVECFRFSPTSVSLFSGAVSLLSLTRLLLRQRPSLVFSFNPKSNLYSAIVCCLLRIAYVPNISGMGTADQLAGIKGWLYQLMMGVFLRRARWTFFQNTENMKAVIERGWVNAERCTLLPGSGVELERFTPPDGITPKSERVFLMASRLLKQKGVQEYLMAAERLTEDSSLNVRCLLAGEFDDSGRCISRQSLAAFAELDGCEYLGHVDDMPALLRQADCVVLPSYYPEGVPRVLIEAIACGRPVITTEQPGCREVVEEGFNGYRIEPRSVDALFEAMQTFLSLSASQVKEMGQHSRRIAESRFDINTVIDAYLQAAARFSARP